MKIYSGQQCAKAGIQERTLRRNVTPFLDLPPNVGVRFAHPNLYGLRHFGFSLCHFHCNARGWLKNSLSPRSQIVICQRLSPRLDSALV
jgi:hypothetical protein